MFRVVEVRLKLVNRTLSAAICCLFVISSPVLAGSIHSWGGDSRLAVSNTPSDPDFSEIAGGQYHSIALKSDGSLKSWGWDFYRQVADTPSANGFKAISAGAAHSLALTESGSLVSWGRDNERQVSSTPSDSGYRAIASGGHVSFAMRTDGSLVGWGSNLYRQLTDTPAGNDFLKVVVGSDATLALKQNGSLVSWGSDEDGQISDTPTTSDFIDIAIGSTHSLALRSDGSLVSWGSDTFGQVSGTPADIGYTDISVGIYSGVALRSDGSIVGWGSDSDGQVSSIPSGFNFQDVSHGGFHALALGDDSNSASEIAVLAVNCSQLTVDEQHIVDFMVSEQFAFDCHTPGSIIERGSLNQYKAIYARFAHAGEPQTAYYDSGAIPIIDDAVRGGSHLIMEYFGGVVGTALGVGTVYGRSGDFTGFGIGNQRGIGNIYYSNPIVQDELLSGIAEYGGATANNLIVQQLGVFSGFVHFEFVGDHAVVDYATFNTNSYHAEAGGAKQTTTSLPTIFGEIYQNIYGGPYQDRVPPNTFITAYKEYGAGRVTNLGPHFGGAVSASQVTFGPVAIQMRRNALEQAGVVTPDKESFYKLHVLLPKDGTNNTIGEVRIVYGTPTVELICTNEFICEFEIPKGELVVLDYVAGSEDAQWSLGDSEVAMPASIFMSRDTTVEGVVKPKGPNVIQMEFTPGENLFLPESKKQSFGNNKKTRRALSINLANIAENYLNPTNGTDDCTQASLEAAIEIDRHDFGKLTVNALAKQIASRALDFVTTASVPGDLLLKATKSVILDDEDVDDAVLKTIAEETVGYMFSKTAEQYRTGINTGRIVESSVKKIIEKEEQLRFWNQSGTNVNGRFGKIGDLPLATVNIFNTYNEKNHYATAVINGSCGASKRLVILRYKAKMVTKQVGNIIRGTGEMRSFNLN